MALTILINDDAGDEPVTGFVDKTAYVRSGSVNLQNTIDQIATASFTIIDETGASTSAPITGQPIKITDGGATVYFWGTIDSLKIQIRAGNDAVFYDCSCTDYSKVLERHLVFNTYTDLTIYTLVSKIIDDFVNLPDAEGITYTIPATDDSPVIEEIRFNYVTAKAALDRLSLLGTDTDVYYWYVDSARALQFIVRPTTAAATALTDDGSSIALANTLRVSQTVQQYRNVQYISNAKYYTIEVVDSWKGDGLQTSFATRYPIGKDVSIAVDGDTKTIGEAGVLTAEFQYEVGKANVWNGTFAAVADGIHAVLSYKGLYPTTATDDNATQIAARKVIEGGSGRYERMDNASDMLGSDTSDSFMAGLLNKNGALNTVIEYDTDTAGLISGTLQATTLARVDIDGSSISAAKYLIESVSARDIGTGQLRYSVRTVSGDDPAQWEDYFLELKNASKTTQFDNTVTLALTEALGTDTFIFIDSESEAVRLMSTDPYVIGDALVGYSEVM